MFLAPVGRRRHRWHAQRALAQEHDWARLGDAYEAVYRAVLRPAVKPAAKAVEISFPKTQKA